jgi:hypothetical protein
VKWEIVKKNQAQWTMICFQSINRFLSKKSYYFILKIDNGKHSEGVPMDTVGRQ